MVLVADKLINVIVFAGLIVMGMHFLVVYTNPADNSIGPKTLIPPHYVVKRFRCSSKAARGEDLQVEHPGARREAAQ
jgi:hypothetical protein